MKKFISGLIVGIMITASLTVFASDLSIAPNPFHVIVDGKDQGQPGYNINGSTYLPLKQISEVIGKDVQFEDNTIYVGKKVSDSEYIKTTYNGMDAIEYNGDVYIQASFLEQNYGIDVTWDGQNKTLILERKDKELIIDANDGSKIIIYNGTSHVNNKIIEQFVGE